MVLILIFFCRDKIEPLQKVIRISPNGHFMVTGGNDGHVRLWQFPQLNKIVDIPAHSQEVDDLDFDRKETQVSEFFIKFPSDL